MDLLKPIKDWVWSIAVKKGIKSLVKLVVAFFTAGAIAPILGQLGITVDQNALQLGLTALINSGLEVLRNYVKTKLGWNFV